MARCKDCVHYEACFAFSKIISSAREVEKGCEYFKDLTKYVEVVRCEDCKYFGHNIENDTYCRCTGGLSDPEENDFCSYGERRTDGN